MKTLPAPTAPAVGTDLGAAARAVLAANWRGRHTVPSARLYPHQWSWDSAFIAIGLARVDQHRAQLELATLFGAQWRDGRVPHIVFDPDTPADAYFPGPRFWAPNSPVIPMRPTSGIVQPPVHARAAWEVYRRAADRPAAADFLRRMYEPLCAWHDYLATRRNLGGAGLAAIVHPWESGMDNSPAWDDAVREACAGGATVQAARADLRHVPASQRPGDADYAAYIDLAGRYRDRSYSDADLLPDHGFAVEDPLFNAAFAWSEESLARIAAVIGANSRWHSDRALALGAAIADRLYDPELGMFVPRDLRTGRQIPVAGVAGLAALVSPGLPPDAVARTCAQLNSSRFWNGHRDGRLLATLDRTSPDFDPQRYWRGPAWANTTWLVISGLRRHGAAAAAEALRSGLLETVRAEGFREYYDADTGAGAGCHDFSWTAALVLDLLG
ncbi:trehalase family glycosidase [Sporichthya sp.]|uniref:MGH1-like glycoside hydrolase domain-containing protein n=1 Tax=Sporichthya sp. TaxID=65475 RepID=UPI0025FFF73F|nr:trehalase family glycosidase [Sporichthya sp.]